MNFDEEGVVTYEGIYYSNSLNHSQTSNGYPTIISSEAAEAMRKVDMV